MFITTNNQTPTIRTLNLDGFFHFKRITLANCVLRKYPKEVLIAFNQVLYTVAGDVSRYLLYTNPSEIWGGIQLGNNYLIILFFSWDINRHFSYWLILKLSKQNWETKYLRITAKLLLLKYIILQGRSSIILGFNPFDGDGGFGHVRGLKGSTRGRGFDWWQKINIFYF